MASGGSPTGAVKVAVRVRPMNSREIKMNATPCIKMKGNQTLILNDCHKRGQDLKDLKNYRPFTFDHSYWSFDAADRDFANQDMVFSDLGEDVINSAFNGYNACVFAYGQTGSGKSYTMMGYDEDSKGLIPRICEGIFTRCAAMTNENTSFNAHVSYLEIYNEKVRDLLGEGKASQVHSLRVREHPKTGPFVEDLTNHEVSNFDGIRDLMERGNDNRTTAATNMNDTSSRSHAIFTMIFTQASMVEGVPSEKVSRLNLVDLAGSERTSSTGATGVRLKEGGNINKSLTTLGLVISALADRGKGKKGKDGKMKHVPYRDSVLTWLLKDSLGGNSKTIMVAAISPADVNHGETMSTLHYANRAKSIVNKPVVNEDENVRLIRELRAEVDRLKSLLGGDEEIAKLQSERDAAMSRYEGATTEEEKAAALQEVEKAKEQLETAQSADKVNLAAQLAKSEQMMDALTGKWQNKWKDTTKIMEDRSLALREQGRAVHVESEQPHLVSLNLDDPLATGVILYYLHDGRTTIGPPDTEPQNDIELFGLDEDCPDCVCTFISDGDETVTLEPHFEGCFINSKVISEPTALQQGSTVQIGEENIFRFNHPRQAEKLKKLRGSSTRSSTRSQRSMRSLAASGVSVGDGMDSGSVPGTPLRGDGIAEEGSNGDTAAAAAAVISPGMVYEMRRMEEEERARLAAERLEELERLQSEREEQERQDGERRSAEEVARKEMEAKLAQLQAIVEQRNNELESLKTESQEHKERAEEVAQERERIELARQEAEMQATALAAKAAEEEKQRMTLAEQASADRERLNKEMKAAEELAKLREERMMQETEQNKFREETEARIKAAEESARKAEENAKRAAARAKQEAMRYEELEKANQEADMQRSLQLQKAHEIAKKESARRQALEGTTKKVMLEAEELRTADQSRQRRLQQEARKRAELEKKVKEIQKSRKRTFEETWHISIPMSHQRGDPSRGSTFLTYELRMSLNGQSWKVQRRFSDFSALNNELKARYPDLGIRIKFPPKKLWPTAAFLKQRQGDLEKFMEDAVRYLSEVPNSPFFETSKTQLMKALPFFRPGALLST